MSAENTVWLEDDLTVPFFFELVDRFVLGEELERKVFGVWRWGEGDFHDSRFGGVWSETSVSGDQPPLLGWVMPEEAIEGCKEVGEAELGYIRAIDVI